ncbi:MAG: transcriptional repressor [Chloroflexi bacterium]|nr:transcriptional repressor [Chloroflexota bacterium]
MSCEKATAQTLKETGHRLTPQRLMILSAIRHAKGHKTATEILAEVKESYPFIDASTIYRTLNVLKEIRLISETDMGGGDFQFEWITPQRHHHLICRACDRVVLLDHNYMEALGEQVMKEHGFETDIDHIALFGTCRECLE